MSSRQKLELTWVGKDERPRLEPRILLEDAALSYHAKARVTEADQFDNRLIFGDNLLALKALEAEFAGSVKCVCIDPPYNTGAAFEHYDDAREHSMWLSLMRARLVLLRSLLSADGSVWIAIDDNEGHYLKVLCDEVFGRRNFVGSVIWNHSVQSKGYSGKFSVHHNYVLVYSKSDSFVLSNLPREDHHNVNYANPDDDPRGPWRAGDVRNSEVRPNLMYDVTTPSGGIIRHPPKGWRFSKETFEVERAAGKIIFSANESRLIRKIYLADQAGRVPETLWSAHEVGTTREASAEVKAIVPEDIFATPKPERLIERILTLATQRGDLVLDSFAGSGTTGAVAHKMGRRWIMVELGEHCHTHIIPRLKKVIDGNDPGGVTEATNWNGGGGFRYFRLAPSLLERDRWGNWVISKQYNAEMLAEAVCKIEGFRYAPSAEVFWQHGQSSEQDFIWVTTQELTAQQLDAIATDVGPNRSLLVCCAAWTGDATTFPNLTLKKIPNAVLARCEFGKDDYSLAIAAMPAPEPVATDDDADTGEPAVSAARRRPAAKRARRSEG